MVCLQGIHSMIQLELHLAVYNQLGPATIKTPMPMPNVPVRGNYYNLIGMSKARRVLQ